jgi:hypothetical protein
MSVNAAQAVFLELPPEASFLSLAVSAAETAGKAWDLGPGRTPRLALAVEEFFEYLRCNTPPGETLRLTLRRRGPALCAEFRFRAKSLDLRAMNFAAGIAPEDGREMGLLLAARFTDRCRLERRGPDGFMLAAEVDRDYPQAEPLRQAPRLQPPYTPLDHPPGDILRHAAMLAAGRYPLRLCPHGFSEPGRLLDMVEAGLYDALVLADAAGRPAGLMLWRAPAERLSVAFSGPYVLDEARDPAIARGLVEGFLARVARTPAVCAVSERPTEDLPEAYFEPLGSVTRTQGGEAVEQRSYFRALREDEGASIWACAELEPFLRQEYERLAFAREILPVEPDGGEAHSLLSTDLDLRRGLAVLRPLLDGRDLAANLARHVEALVREGAPDIFLHLDLGQAWQAAMAPAILAAGFQPRLLLPHGATSDMVVFEHGDAAH